MTLAPPFYLAAFKSYAYLFQKITWKIFFLTKLQNLKENSHFFKSFSNKSTSFFLIITHPLPKIALDLKLGNSYSCKPYAIILIISVSV